MGHSESKFRFEPYLLEAKLGRLIKTLEKHRDDCRKYDDVAGALAFSKAIKDVKDEFNL